MKNPNKVRAWLQGSRGGWYYVNERGEKRWGKEALEAARKERVPLPKTRDPLVLMQRAKAAVTPTTARSLTETALKQGGLTFDAVQGSYPSKGYVVSTHPEREVQTKELKEEDVAKYLEENKDFIENTEGAHLGIWYDEDKQKWFLDVSHVTEDRNEARQGALEHGQLGFYDIVAGKTEDMRQDPEWLAKWPERAKMK